MGSLAGHIIPGSFALLMGIVWMLHSLWAYLSAKLCHTKPTTYTESHLERKSYIPQPFLPKVPFEPIFKQLLPGLMIIMECFFYVRRDENGQEHVSVGISSVYDESVHLGPKNELHHLTIYIFFVASGMVDLLSLYVVRYPKHTTQLFLGFAFLVEGFLFSFHLPGRSLFSVAAHKILIYAVFANASFAFLRMYKSANLLINGGFAFCTTLQGTLLILMGVVLYDEHPLDEDSSPMFHSAVILDFVFLRFLLIAITVLTLYAVLLVCSSHAANKEKTPFHSLNTPDKPDIIQEQA